jgi:hypothetical protein
MFWQCSTSLIVINSKERRSQHRWWVHKFLKERKSHGAYNSILSKLCTDERRRFNNVIHMIPTDFEGLLNMVSLIISRKNTSFRHAILQVISWLLH